MSWSSTTWPPRGAAVERQPGLVAVTREGDLLGREHAAGGSATTPSLLEVQAAVDEADRAARRGRAPDRPGRGSRCRRRWTSRPWRPGTCRPPSTGCTSPTPGWRPSPSSSASSAPRPGPPAARPSGWTASIARRRRAARRRPGCARRARGAARRAASSRRSRPDDASPTPRCATSSRRPPGAPGRPRSRHRLAVRTGEERVRALSGRADQLARAAAQEREDRARARGPPGPPGPRGRRGAARSRWPRRPPSPTWSTRCARAAEAARARPSGPGPSADAEMGGLRGRLRELGADLERLTDSVHRDEVARAEQRLRIEALQEKALEDLGVEPEALVEEYGPHQLVPPSPPAPDEVREVEPEPDAVRPRRAGEAAARRRAGAGPARPGQPAGAGGVRRRWRSGTSSSPSSSRTSRPPAAT